jgi:hypothetical protein
MWCLGCEEDDAKKRCGKCEWATYCGKRCQIDDWRETHKENCHRYVSYRALVKAACKALQNIHVSLFVPFLQAKRDIIVMVTQAEPNVLRLKAAIRVCMESLKPDQHRNLRGESGSVVVIILPQVCPTILTGIIKISNKSEKRPWSFDR